MATLPWRYEKPAGRFSGFRSLCRGQEVSTTPIVSGLSAPTDIQDALDGSGRLFLVQQGGVVRILRGGALLSRPFLNVTAKTRGGGERGLLGLAFPSGYAHKGRFGAWGTMPPVEVGTRSSDRPGGTSSIEAVQRRSGGGA